jgi:hypothetical protein
VLTVPYVAWDRLIDDESVRQWADDLAPSTARNYVYYFVKYLAWARDQGYWSSADSLIADERDLGANDRFRHVDVLKQYIKSLETGMSDRRNRWYAVKSFYDYHRVLLPKLPRSEMSRLFTPSSLDKRRAIQMKPLEVDEVRQLVLHAPQPYKAVFLVLFQSAMGFAEFEEFNTLGWRGILDHLDEPGPVKIDFYRSKTSTTRVNKYYTFIGEDAKHMIHAWLAIRPQTSIDALFVVLNKNLNEWVPLKGRNIGHTITKLAKKIGLIQANTLGRYHVHAHEFRDLFKSLCTLNGLVPVASEFFLGHRIDKAGYDKSPDYDVDWFRTEYLKVAPQLNIISQPQQREDLKKEVALEAIRRFAEAFGINPMSVRIEKQREIGRVLKTDEEILAIQNAIKKMREPDDDPQIIVPEGELETYLQDGWEFVSVLPSHKILIRK